MEQTDKIRAVPERAQNVLRQESKDGFRLQNGRYFCRGAS